MVVLISKVIDDLSTLIIDKLEDSVLHLERRRIEKENGRKAQSAMEALGVSKPNAKSDDVDFVVCDLLALLIVGQTDWVHTNGSGGSVERRRSRQSAHEIGQACETGEIGGRWSRIGCITIYALPAAFMALSIRSPI